MNILSLSIPIYEWSLTVFCNVSSTQDQQAVINQCNKYGVPDDITEQLLSNIRGKQNSGNHLCCSEIRTAFIFYTPITSEIDFWGIFTHEISHLITEISQYHGLETEGQAYLTGFIYKTLFQLGLMDELKSSFFDNNIATEQTTVDKAKGLSEDFLKCMGLIEDETAKKELSKEMLLCLTSEFSGSTVKQMLEEIDGPYNPE